RPSGWLLCASVGGLASRWRSRRCARLRGAAGGRGEAGGRRPFGGAGVAALAGEQVGALAAQFGEFPVDACQIGAWVGGDGGGDGHPFGLEAGVVDGGAHRGGCGFVVFDGEGFGGGGAAVDGPAGPGGGGPGGGE